MYARDKYDHVSRARLCKSDSFPQSLEVELAFQASLGSSHVHLNPWDRRCIRGNKNLQGQTIKQRYIAFLSDLVHLPSIYRESAFGAADEAYEASC